MSVISHARFLSPFNANAARIRVDAYASTFRAGDATDLGELTGADTFDGGYRAPSPAWAVVLLRDVAQAMRERAVRLAPAYARDQITDGPDAQAPAGPRRQLAWALVREAVRLDRVAGHRANMNAAHRPGRVAPSPVWERFSCAVAGRTVWDCRVDMVMAHGLPYAQARDAVKPLIPRVDAPHIAYA